MKSMALKFTFVAVASAALLAAPGSYAAGGLAVSREVTVDNSPATVWKLVGNFDALDVWHPAVKSSVLKGSGTKVGSTRMLTLAGGGDIIENLTAYSAGKTGYSYSYGIVKGPLPVKNYLATISLAPTADGKTLIVWKSTFDAEGVPDDKAAEVIGGIYDSGLAKVVANFAKQ
jgi:mxaD protein